MTPEEFTHALNALGWSRRYLADLLDCDHNLPNRWASGRADIPPSIAHWLGVLSRYHDRFPTPTDWRVWE